MRCYCFNSNKRKKKQKTNARFENRYRAKKTWWNAIGKMIDIFSNQFFFFLFNIRDFSIEATEKHLPMHLNAHICQLASLLTCLLRNFVNAYRQIIASLSLFISYIFTNFSLLCSLLFYNIFLSYSSQAFSILLSLSLS